METIEKVISRWRHVNPIQWTLSIDDERCLQGIVKDPHAPNGVLIEPSTTLI